MSSTKPLENIVLVSKVIGQSQSVSTTSEMNAIWNSIVARSFFPLRHFLWVCGRYISDSELFWSAVYMPPAVCSKLFVQCIPETSVV